jgi:hypothetical protein
MSACMLKRSAESTAGPTKGTMDSATLEQQPQHHYKRPYLRLANSFAESIDSLPGQQLLEQENGPKTGVIIAKV